MLDAHKQEQINTTVDNKLLATQALDNKQTQDIDHNAAAIADNTNHIGQVEHDADTRAHNQEQINTAVDNKLQATQVLDNKQTQDIGHNMAAIADNTNHIGQVEHDADARAHNQEQINTAVDNKLQATQTLDYKQTQDIGHNMAAIADNTNHIGQVEHDADTRAHNQEQINTAVDNKLQATQALDNKQTQDIGHNAAAIADNTDHIDEVEHHVDNNSAAIAQNEQRIEKLEASNNENFSKLKEQVDENRQRASAAISGVAAMANIPQVIQGQTFSVGAGVGTTDGESALAVGFSARATEHTVVKASVSNDSQQNFVVGGGVSYGW